MKWNHIGIKTADIDKSIHFYCDILGFRKLEEVEVLGKLYHFVGNDTVKIEIEPCKPEDTQADMRRHSGLYHLCFTVDDIEKTAAGTKFCLLPEDQDHQAKEKNGSHTGNHQFLITMVIEEGEEYSTPNSCQTLAHLPPHHYPDTGGGPQQGRFGVPVLGLVAEHGIVNPGTAQVRGGLHPGDGHEAQAGVLEALHLLGDDLMHRFVHLPQIGAAAHRSSR